MSEAPASTTTSTAPAATTTTAPAATTAAAPAATTTTAAAAPQDWTSSLDETTRGYVQNKGFKDPSAVLESYRNLEKLMGVPKERLLTLPDKEDAPEWKEIYDKMGRPASADEYKFEVPKENGDENFAKWAKGTFHELGLSRKQAETLAAKWNEFAGGTAQQMQTQMKERFEQSASALKKEWGAAFEQNTNIAKSAAQQFGVTKEVIDKMEADMGYAEVMKFMHSVGTKVGEAGFVGSNSTQGFGAMTPAQALAKISALKSDTDFIRRYGAGDSAARSEMEKLHRFAYPDLS